VAAPDRVAGGAGNGAGWVGRTTVLDRFQAEMDGRDSASVTLTVRVNGQDLPSDLGSQTQALRACLAAALRPDGPGVPTRAVELLGLDEPGGQVQLGLGIGALFLSGLTAGFSFLLAGWRRERRRRRGTPPWQDRTGRWPTLPAR
jgi:hypothetical protein